MGGMEIEEDQTILSTVMTPDEGDLFNFSFVIVKNRKTSDQKHVILSQSFIIDLASMKKELERAYKEFRPDIFIADTRTARLSELAFEGGIKQIVPDYLLRVKELNRPIQEAIEILNKAQVLRGLTYISGLKGPLSSRPINTMEYGGLLSQPETDCVRALIMAYDNEVDS